MRTSAELSAAAGTGVLGVLPVDRALRDGAAPSTVPAGPFGEAVRRIRTNLLFADVDQPPPGSAFERLAQWPEHRRAGGAGLVIGPRLVRVVVEQTHGVDRRMRPEIRCEVDTDLARSRVVP